MRNRREEPPAKRPDRAAEDPTTKTFGMMTRCTGNPRNLAVPRLEARRRCPAFQNRESDQIWPALISLIP